MNENRKLLTKSVDSDFLRAELLTGMTLCRIALDSSDEGKKSRNVAHVCKAYDAVVISPFCKSFL